MLPLVAARPASLAGAEDIQRTTESMPMPRLAAPVIVAKKPICKEAMPPHARMKSPVSMHLVDGGAGEWSVATRSMSPALRAVSAGLPDDGYSFRRREMDDVDARPVFAGKFDEQLDGRLLRLWRTAPPPGLVLLRVSFRDEKPLR